MNGIIYLIINEHNLLRNLSPYLYIGSTAKSGNEYNKYLGSSKALTKDIKLLGRDNFSKIALLENTFQSMSDLQEMEAIVQKEFDVVNNIAFYNKNIANSKLHNDGTYSTGTVWINNGVKNKRIKQENLPKYPLWNIGRLNGNYMEDRVYINDSVYTKSIPREDLHLYPAWNIGRIKGNQSGKTWINNSIIRKLVKQEEVENYMSDNWTIGYNL